jgi:hypothetical protein
MNRREFLLTPALFALQAQDRMEPLFDGSTLRGWSVQDGPESAFYVKDGAIAGSPSSDFPAWLRSDKQYENFDFRCEFFVQGWIDGGIYLHAPEHGRQTWTGMQIKIFHQLDKEPRPNSMGAVFPLVAPAKVNVRSEGQWNSMRILMEWPRLRVWVNEEVVQDLNVESVPDLRYRLRRGYLGLSALSYPIRFRNLAIRELPGTERWDYLYETDADFEKWHTSEGDPKFASLNGVLRADGSGHIATREQYRDFQLHLYIRGERHHNGGILFRSDGKGLSARHYEIQVHDVEEAHYPTGSLYYFKRAAYPRIESEKWFLMQLVVKDRNCLVRINGENVMEYDRLENLDSGHIELQAHQPGRWLEYKHIWIRRL